MRMPMMDVRIVGVLMGQDFVAMLMRMRLVADPCKGMLMLMMRVVAMGVAVLQRLVRVNVLVPLSQMEPETCTH